MHPSASIVQGPSVTSHMCSAEGAEEVEVELGGNVSETTPV